MGKAHGIVPADVGLGQPPGAGHLRARRVIRRCHHRLILQARDLVLTDQQSTIVGIRVRLQAIGAEAAGDMGDSAILGVADVLTIAAEFDGLVAQWVVVAQRAVIALGSDGPKRHRATAGHRDQQIAIGRLRVVEFLFPFHAAAGCVACGRNRAGDRDGEQDEQGDRPTAAPVSRVPIHVIPPPV